MTHQFDEAPVSDELIEAVIADVLKDSSFSIQGKLFRMPSDIGLKNGIAIYRNNMATKEECRKAGKRMARNAGKATHGIPNMKARVMQDPEHPHCGMVILSFY